MGKQNTTRVAMGRACDTITMTAIWLKNRLNDGNFVRSFGPKPQQAWDKARRRWDSEERLKARKRSRRWQRKNRLLLPGKVSITEKILTAGTAITGVYLMVAAIARFFGVFLAMPSLSFLLSFWH